VSAFHQSQLYPLVRELEIPDVCHNCPHGGVCVVETYYESGPIAYMSKVFDIGPGAGDIIELVPLV